MRIASSVTSISWIPSEAVTGLNKGIFESGFAHYDDPPPITSTTSTGCATPMASVSPTGSRYGSRWTTAASSPAAGVAAG